jgi:hypothetical protein
MNLKLYTNINQNRMHLFVIKVVFVYVHNLYIQTSELYAIPPNLLSTNIVLGIL